MEMWEHALALVTEIYHAAFEVTIPETAPFPYAKLKSTVMRNFSRSVVSFQAVFPLLFI